jgi:hypothetical protein
MYNVLYNSTVTQIDIFEQFEYNITYNNTIAHNFIYAYVFILCLREYLILLIVLHFLGVHQIKC